MSSTLPHFQFRQLVLSEVKHRPARSTPPPPKATWDTDARMTHGKVVSLSPLSPSSNKSCIESSSNMAGWLDHTQELETK
jgi:hypothetical protein